MILTDFETGLPVYVIDHLLVSALAVSQTHDGKLFTRVYLAGASSYSFCVQETPDAIMEGLRVLQG